MPRELKIPELSLVVLIGASGSGKSTFAKKHFLPTEVISSDDCRAMVSDDAESMEATSPAFELVHTIADKRLAFGKLAVIDATNVKADSRKPLVRLARDRDCLAVAVVLNLPEKVCQERNKAREDRQIPEHVIRNHVRQLKQSLRGLKREGFRYVYTLDGADEIEEAVFVRQPLWNNKQELTGPFDIIGDIHGCYDELMKLLAELGYRASVEDGRNTVSHPEGRSIIFLGDLGDRGPKILETLSFVKDLCEAGDALCVCGNHEEKLLRWLSGKNVQATHGLDQTIASLEAKDDDFKKSLRGFIDGLVSHYVLDGGKLVVAHAGLKESYQGRSSGRVRSFALYGDTTGETDEYGLPVRFDWTNEYRGSAWVVYGHTPVPEIVSQNRTVNIDTGCVFGGKLTAYRYPEREAVSVPAERMYYEPAKPLADARKGSEHARTDDLPEIEDVIGSRNIETRLTPAIGVRKESAMAALETMSRFAIDPKWLVYLPPTMSPCETSEIDGILEHPKEAFRYFQTNGVERVVCEQKHMGSRAVVVVCKDEATAQERFDVEEGVLGACYTRTGRSFFDDPEMGAAFIDALRDQLVQSGFFDEFETGWVCLDCELMPWSAKAQTLLQRQYAPTGVAGVEGLRVVTKLLEKAKQRGSKDFEVSPLASGQNLDLGGLLSYYQERKDAVEKYRDAYRVYCWPTARLDGLKLAPFHILATEGMVHAGKDHVWHMETVKKYLVSDECPLTMATPYMLVETESDESVAAGIAWWESLTASGGEGMVVKPYNYIATGKRGLVQPAIKCRGPEYLRIIYGPEYLLPENLPRLKKRSLSRKRSLAQKEFALGVESLERFCQKEPFWRVHECVFAVLAMESEPVDPRL